MSFSLPTSFSKEGFSFASNSQEKTTSQPIIEDDFSEDDESQPEKSQPSQTKAPVVVSQPDDKIDEEEDEEEQGERSEQNDDQEAQRLRTKRIQKAFSKEQERRYECYKRASFKKSIMKGLINQYSGATCNPTTVIVVSGITKLFVGELVETAKLIMEERGDKGAIQPKHLHEANRRLTASGKIPMKYPKRVFV